MLEGGEAACHPVKEKIHDLGITPSLAAILPFLSHFFRKASMLGVLRPSKEAIFLDRQSLS